MVNCVEALGVAGVVGVVLLLTVLQQSEAFLKSSDMMPHK